MVQEQLYGEISDAIVNLDKDKAIELAKLILREIIITPFEMIFDRLYI